MLCVRNCFVYFIYITSLSCQILVGVFIISLHRWKKRGCSKFSDLAEVIRLEVKGREVGSVSQTPSWHPYGLETLLFKTPRMYF